jgi:transcriptional regulator with XRE-family HTH domain
MTNDPLIFSIAVRNKRKELRMTQAALAKSSGLARETISRFETGKEILMLCHLSKVLDCLGLTFKVVNSSII